MDKLGKIYKQELAKTSSISEVYTLLNFIQGLTVEFAQARWGYSQRTLAGWFKVSNETVSQWSKRYKARLLNAEAGK